MIKTNQTRRIPIPLKFTCLIIMYFGFLTQSSEAFDLCPGFEGTSVRSPELKFTAMKKMMDDWVVVRKEKKEILINRTKIFEVRLDCWASYPIDLTFSGHLTNQKTTVKTSNNPYFLENGDKGQCYRINATMETYEEITGNYSCFAVTNLSRRNSKYIYVYSAPPGVLLKRGQNITVLADSTKNTILLPCAVSNPDVEVQLHKGNENDRNWLLPSRTLKYDPKVGYVMTLDKSERGSYQCRTAVSAMDVVNIEVMSPPEWKVEPKLGVLRLKIGDRLNLTCMSNEEVHISLTQSNLHEGAITLRNYTKSSRVYKHLANVNIEVDANDKIRTGIAQCLRKRDNSTIHTWQLIISNETRKHGVLEMSRITDSCPNSDKSGTKALVLYECNNWIECRINRCVGKDSTCQPSNRCQLWACNPHGLMQCVTSEGTILEIYFTGFNGTRYTNGQLAPQKEILRLQMPKPLNSLESKTINFLCEGSSFVIASGFQWSFFFNNGTSRELTHFHEGTTIKETWGQTKSILSSTLTLPAEFYKGTEITGIGCFAPLWNSTGWINETMRIDDIQLRFQEIHEQSESKPSETEKSAGSGFHHNMYFLYGFKFIAFSVLILWI